MIPLPSFATVRLVALVAGIAAAGFGGWTVRGWKADTAINGLRTTIALGVANAATEARRIERKEQEVVNEALRTQNNSLAGNAATLRSDLERMRQRAERRDATGVPAAPRPDCAGATGAELSRTDAEFLVREAARADDIRAGLVACYQVIDGIQ
jgi:hypothetical protein